MTLMRKIKQCTGKLAYRQSFSKNYLIFQLVHNSMKNPDPNPDLDQHQNRKSDSGSLGIKTMPNHNTDKKYRYCIDIALLLQYQHE